MTALPSFGLGSHESAADESNLSVEFVEFCYWHVNHVISSSSGCRSLPAIDPHLCIAGILPFQIELGRFRISHIVCPKTTTAKYGAKELYAS